MALLGRAALLAILAGLTITACAEVTRPIPSRHEVEAVQLTSLLRHPRTNYSEERAMRVFIRLLATLPRVHGRTYPFLGFNWWVTAAGQPVVDQVWQPSPAAEPPLKKDVTLLGEESSADRRGGYQEAALRPGDLILAVNGMNLPAWLPQWRQFSDHIREVLRYSLPGNILVKLARWSENLRLETEGLYRGGPVTLLVEREGVKRQITLYPLHLPAEYGLMVVRGAAGQEYNAYAAPGLVMISYKLIALCRTDDELAVILGHELAHQAHGHWVRAKGQWALGRFAGDILAALLTFGANWPFTPAGSFYRADQDLRRFVSQAVVSTYSRDNEREADAYGLWYAYQAGYDTDRGLDVWERLAAVAGGDIFAATHYTDSHPPAAERLARLKQIGRSFSGGKAAEVLVNDFQEGGVAGKW